MHVRLITLLVKYWKYIPVVLGIMALVLKLVFAEAELDPVPDEDGPALW